MLTLSKTAETATTITLAWQPPAGVDCYAFFANGQRVSVGDASNKDGSPRVTVKYSKTAPGPPFNVVALIKAGAGFSVEWGQYPQPGQVVYPSLTRYPSEVL